MAELFLTPSCVTNSTPAAPTLEERDADIRAFIDAQRMRKDVHAGLVRHDTARSISPMELRLGIIGDFWAEAAAHQALWVVTQMTAWTGSRSWSASGGKPIAKPTRRRCAMGWWSRRRPPRSWSRSTVSW